MAEAASAPTIKACVVVPVYNNAATIGAVLAGIREHLDQIIVVDDGSTDGTQDILATASGIVLVRHERNRGKGAALRSGFERAWLLGFSHAVTMDGDGQHEAGDLPALLAAVRERPEALVLGVRQLKQPGWRAKKSRLLRAHSNFWVWLETGVRSGDSQTGMRAYPLTLVEGLSLSRSKYDFEIEVLVKAVWAGAPVVRVPIQVSWRPGGVSHFRPLRDFWLVSTLNVHLLLLRLVLPPALCGVIFLKTFRRQRPVDCLAGVWRQTFGGVASRPGAAALAVGLGVALGILPIWGLQMVTGLLVAHWLRLNKALLLAASNISIPVLAPFIIYASLVTGRWLCGRPALVMPGNVLMWSLDYVVGSVVLAVLAGAAAGALAYVVAAISRRTRLA